MEFLIYVICLGVGVLFTLITAIAGHVFGGGHHADIGSGGHAESGADATAGDGPSAFSPTIIASFVAAFGGFGMIFHQVPALRPTYVSAPLAVVGAFGVASGMLYMLRQLFRKTQSSSEGHVGSLVGVIATIITPIPQGGVGEIAYVQAGTRYTAPARTETGAAVAAGRPVKITRIVGSQYFVQPA